MINWLIQRYRKGTLYNVFDAKLHSSNRVMISLGDYSPFDGTTTELNVWFDKDEFLDIYSRFSSIYNQLKENE